MYFSEKTQKKRDFTFKFITTITITTFTHPLNYGDVVLIIKLLYSNTRDSKMSSIIPL